MLACGLRSAEGPDCARVLPRGGGAALSRVCVACACAHRCAGARADARHAQDGLAWDSLHYLRIAQCGYETEQSHAFFPLLPGAMRAAQATGTLGLRSCSLRMRADSAPAALRSLLPALYPRCTLALAGVLISNAAFVLAALALYWRAPAVLTRAACVTTHR
jgi:phosphatidylinositol glycan class V